MSGFAMKARLSTSTERCSFGHLSCTFDGIIDLVMFDVRFILPIVGLVIAGPAWAEREDAPSKAVQNEVFGPPSPPREAESTRLLAIEMYRSIATREAKARNLPPEIADAVMKIESNYNPRARGRDGEYGIMQVMPPTARLLGHTGPAEALAEPETNIKLGVRYLAEAYDLAGGDLCTTLMKYRAGHKETRFSVLSVNYCLAARNHLAARGYALKGDVPAATFGFSKDVTRMGSFLGTRQAAMRLRSGKKLRSRANWGEYDARMKALTSRGNIRL